MQTFLKAYRLLSLAHRKKIIPIIFLLTLNSLLDFFSLASFLPVFIFIVTPEAISTNTYFNDAYHFLPFTSPQSFIIAITVCVLVLVLIKNLIGAVIMRIKANYAYNISSELSLRLLSQHFHLSLEKFHELDYSREANRISSHPVAFANNVILPTTTIFSEALIVLFILTGIAVFDFHMIAIICAVLAPVFFIFSLKKSDLANISTVLKEKYPAMLKDVYATIEGFPEIKIFSKERYFTNKFKKSYDEFVRALIKGHSLQTDNARLLEIIVGLTMCSVVIYATATEQSSKHLLLLLGLYAGAAFRLIPSINRMVYSLQQIKMHEHVIRELNYSPVASTTQTILKQGSVSFKEKIELDNISFQYVHGPQLLSHISMVIEKGKMIAVTGKSGSGKTTLLLILLRLLKESEGNLLIDGEIIKDDQSWRKQMGYVPQQPYILDGSLVENIAFGVEPDLVDRDKIGAIVKQLDLVKIVEELPQGMDSPIGERGAKLSGGQKQRIAIGRALYHDSEILLLDEVTNQVHTELEDEIFSVLKRLADNQKTVIVVTHKIPSSNPFNKIYRLENKTMELILN